MRILFQLDHGNANLAGSLAGLRELSLQRGFALTEPTGAEAAVNFFSTLFAALSSAPLPTIEGPGASVQGLFEVARTTMLQRAMTELNNARAAGEGDTWVEDSYDWLAQQISNMTDAALAAGLTEQDLADWLLRRDWRFTAPDHTWTALYAAHPQGHPFIATMTLAEQLRLARSGMQHDASEIQSVH